MVRFRFLIPLIGDTAEADFTGLAVWGSLESQNLENFEVIEYRLSLSIHPYSNITVSKNKLNVENDTQVPLEHVGPSNPGLNNFKPADGEFQQRKYSHFMLRIYQRQENY